jgi:hypothetical protein
MSEESIRKEFKIFEYEEKWYVADLNTASPRIVVGPCETMQDAHFQYVIWSMTATLNNEPGFEDSHEMWKETRTEEPPTDEPKD